MPKGNIRWVETLLFRGFLVRTIRIGDLAVRTKTLNKNELQAIRFETSDPSTLEARTAAYSMFMFGSCNVLVGNRSKNIEQLTGIFTRLPHAVLSLLSSSTQFINYMQEQAVPDLQRYLETESTWLKFREYQLAGVPLNSPVLTGIPGTECLGLNHLQSQWLVAMDLKTQERTDKERFQYFKLLGSLINPKAIQKIEEREQLLERVQEEREALDLPEELLLKKPVDTTEDLVDELDRSIKGEMDLHDKILAETEKSWLRESYNEYKEQEAQRTEHKDTFDVGDGTRVIDIRKKKK